MDGHLQELLEERVRALIRLLTCACAFRDPFLCFADLLRREGSEVRNARARKERKDPRENRMQLSVDTNVSCIDEVGVEGCKEIVLITAGV